MFKVYTIDGCPYCKLAISLIQEIFSQCEIHVVESGKKDLVKKQFNRSTFPIIFMNDKLIGGYTDLRTQIMTNELGKNDF